MKSIKGLVSKYPYGYYTDAKGIEVKDINGTWLKDMCIMGVGACILGYTDPDVNNAVIDCIDRGSMSTYNCPEDEELAELLCKLHPWAEKVRYARTGGEAGRPRGRRRGARARARARARKGKRAGFVDGPGLLAGRLAFGEQPQLATPSRAQAKPQRSPRLHGRRGREHQHRSIPVKAVRPPAGAELDSGLQLQTE